MFYTDLGTWHIGSPTLQYSILVKERLIKLIKLKLYIEQQSDNLQVSNDELKLLKSLKRKIKLIEFNSSQQTNLHSFFNK